MMSPQIKRIWLFSAGAGRLYFISSLAGITFLTLLLGMELRIGFKGALVLDFWIVLILQVIFYIGAVGFAILWIAMWLCLLNFEKETMAGSIYLPVFVLLGGLAALIYYFARYRGLLKAQPKAVAISA